LRKILLRRKNVKLLSLRLSLAILLACGVMAVCSASAVAQDAASTYKAKCAMCHGADGKGGKMGTKDFASPDIKGMTDAQLADVITKGKPPRMPAYGDKLKESEIKDLVAYIRTLGK
jgi:cytochrome c6